jgi:hypothetical protein
MAESMKARIPLRFSLLTVLIVVTLICVTTSHILTSIRLSRIEERNRELQRTIRERNDRDGILTVDDPQLVHVIARVPDINDAAVPTPPTGCSWQMHIPSGKKYRICWATSQIPLEGLPGLKSGDRLLRTGSENLTRLEVRYPEPVNPATDRCLFLFEFDCSTIDPADDDWWQSRVLPEDNLWLDETPCSFEVAGGDCQWGNSFTESFSPIESIVLLRIRRQSPQISRLVRYDDPQPGFMVWLEPEAVSKFSTRNSK